MPQRTRYWNDELLPAFLSDVLRRPQQAGRLRHVLSAFQDPRPLLLGARHFAAGPDDDDDARTKAHVAGYKGPS